MAPCATREIVTQDASELQGINPNAEKKRAVSGKLIDVV